MLSDFLNNFAVIIARIAEHHIMSLYRLHQAGFDTGIEDVKDHGLVGRADREAEAAFMASLPLLIAGTVTATGEESYNTKGQYQNIIRLATANSEYLIIVDPVDGTKGFNDKTGTFGCMATVLKRNPVTGKFEDYAAWLYNPNTQQMLCGDTENVWLCQMAAVENTTRFEITDWQRIPSFKDKAGKTVLIDRNEFADIYQANVDEFIRLLTAAGFEVAETTAFCHQAMTELILNPDIAAYIRAPMKAHDVQPGITLLRAKGGVANTFADQPYDIEKVIGGLIAAKHANVQQTIQACFVQAFPNIDFTKTTLAKPGVELKDDQLAPPAATPSQ